jgi:hypothetical protein
VLVYQLRSHWCRALCCDRLSCTVLIGTETITYRGTAACHWHNSSRGVRVSSCLPGGSHGLLVGFLVKVSSALVESTVGGGGVVVVTH